MRYKYLVDRHNVPVLGKYQVNRISSQLVERFVDDKLKNGRLDGGGSLSPKTVTDIITIIKSSMDYASYNVYAVACNLNKLSVKKKEKERRVLTLQEQKGLTSVLLNETDLTKLGVLLSLYTGIKIVELCASHRENLSIESKTLKVRETMQRIPSTEVS